MTHTKEGHALPCCVPVLQYACMICWLTWTSHGTSMAQKPYIKLGDHYGVIMPARLPVATRLAIPAQERSIYEFLSLLTHALKK